MAVKIVEYLLEYNNLEMIRPSDELSGVYWLPSDQVLKNLQNSYDYWAPVFKQVVEFLYD